MEARKQANLIRGIIIIILLLLSISIILVFGNILSHDTYYLKIIEKTEQIDNSANNIETGTARVGAGFFTKPADCHLQW